jgi:hypothetical protein
VVSSTSLNKLDYVDRRTLTDTDRDLTVTGTPDRWFLEGDVLNVYPASASEALSVRYVASAAELASDSDTPLVPTRFQDLIVDGAVIRGLKDSDNYEAVSALRVEYDRQVQLMANSLLNRDLASSELIVSSAGWSY